MLDGRPSLNTQCCSCYVFFADFRLTVIGIKIGPVSPVAITAHADCKGELLLPERGPQQPCISATTTSSAPDLPPEVAPLCTRIGLSESRERLATACACYGYGGRTSVMLTCKRCGSRAPLGLYTDLEQALVDVLGRLADHGPPHPRPALLPPPSGVDVERAATPPHADSGGHVGYEQHGKDIKGSGYADTPASSVKESKGATVLPSPPIVQHAGTQPHENAFVADEALARHLLARAEALLHPFHWVLVQHWRSATHYLAPSALMRTVLASSDASTGDTTMSDLSGPACNLDTAHEADLLALLGHCTEVVIAVRRVLLVGPTQSPPLPQPPLPPSSGTTSAEGQPVLAPSPPLPSSSLQALSPAQVPPPTASLPDEPARAVPRVSIGVLAPSAQPPRGLQYYAPELGGVFLRMGLAHTELAARYHARLAAAPPAYTVAACTNIAGVRGAADDSNCDAARAAAGEEGDEDVGCDSHAELEGRLRHHVRHAELALRSAHRCFVTMLGPDHEETRCVFALLSGSGGGTSCDSGMEGNGGSGGGGGGESGDIGERDGSGGGGEDVG